jgi:hypothetical protein
MGARHRGSKISCCHLIAWSGRREGQEDITELDTLKQKVNNAIFECRICSPRFIEKPIRFQAGIEQQNFSAST